MCLVFNSGGFLLNVKAVDLRRGGLGGGYEVPRGGTPFGGAKSMFDGGFVIVVFI